VPPAVFNLQLNLGVTTSNVLVAIEKLGQAVPVSVAAIPYLVELKQLRNAVSCLRLQLPDLYTKSLIPLLVISLIFGPFAGAAAHLLMKTMLSVEFKDEPANVSLVFLLG
jgi:hypothetical protein